jgi:solute carrier family 25 thiamine pyrophosphate transporter 19
MSSQGLHLKDEGSRLQVVSAGAVAGLVSRFVIAPLDVIKIRQQLQTHARAPAGPTPTPDPGQRGTLATFRHILRHEGITGFWKGNVPAEAMYVGYAAVQFTAYRSTALFLQRSLPFKLPDAAESFVAGAASGAAATTVTYPRESLTFISHRLVSILRTFLYL